MVSHYMVIKLKLASEIIAEAGSRVTLLDPGNMLQGAVDTAYINAPDSGERAPGGGSLLIVFEPTQDMDLEGLAEGHDNILVFTTPGSPIRIPRFFAKMFIDRIDERTYIMRMQGGRTLRILVNPEGLRFIDKPEGAYGRAYDLVTGLMAEHGEVTVKDAVRAISLELGVSREAARRILYRLVEERYLRIVRGRISLG